ncbi:MAG: hypothetical protein U1F98_03565 [Verrucomicrobiota bacterium]
MKLLTVLCLVVPLCGFSERINQEGRILGPAISVTNSILFNTTNADAVLASMQILPVTNPWNEDISQRPRLSNSDAMIAQIMADLSASRRTLQVFQEMNFVLVPDNQSPVPIEFVDYPDESDPSPYPIHANLPIEGWPTQVNGETLSQVQQDSQGLGGDRHSITVKPGSGFAWETWQTLKVGTNWQASNGALFNLNTNALRPDGWTSGDAAGLPMFPALVRYDECERGMVEHACRIVVARSRKAHLYPATHDASSTAATYVNVPAMGQRVRLKSGFVIPSGWAREEKALLLGLKKYGALVADNGGFFSISITPDDRWPANAFSHISGISITNFEVVQSTGPTEGPRSPGAPSVNAGPDQTVLTGSAVTLQGSVQFTGSLPAVQWVQYSGPAAATISDATRTNSTVTFPVAGVYTLRLGVADGVHAVAYDAVTFAAGAGRPVVSAVLSGPSTLALSWSGGAPPYVVETAPHLPPASWTAAVTTSVQSVEMPITNNALFFRVLSR